MATGVPSDDGREGDSKTERAVRHAQRSLIFGCDSNSRAYAREDDPGGNPTCYPLEGREFKDWLQYEAYSYGDMLKKEEINEVIQFLKAYARFEGEEATVHLRTAKAGSCAVELDCGDDEHTRVRLKNGEVKIMTSGSDKLFHRSSSIQPMIKPAEQANWQDLLPFLNMSEEEQLLLIAWMTYILAHPKGSDVGYPLLIVKGEQGAGKSFLCKSLIRQLVDPNSVGIQIFPKSTKDLVISSLNAYVLIYDNLRKLTTEFSDALCIAATGGSISTRKLYTDSEEHIMHLHAPVVLNGIHNFVEEPDLASRCLNIQLIPMDAERRERESVLESQLQSKLPGIFRGLLELAAKGLQIEDEVEVIYPERMLGYVHWLAAMETLMELPAGQLQLAYRRNLKQVMLDTIQENPLAYSVLQFAREYSDEPWQGRPQELLTALEAHVPRRFRGSSNEWPNNAISLSKRLATLHKALTAQGVILKLGERGKHRKISIGFSTSEDC